MGTLTPGDLAMMIVVTILGIAFFIGVCATIYFLFKRLEREDKKQLQRDGQIKENAVHSKTTRLK